MALFIRYFIIMPYKCPLNDKFITTHSLCSFAINFFQINAFDVAAAVVVGFLFRPFFISHTYLQINSGFSLLVTTPLSREVFAHALNLLYNIAIDAYNVYTNC